MSPASLAGAEGKAAKAEEAKPTTPGAEKPAAPAAPAAPGPAAYEVPSIWEDLQVFAPDVLDSSLVSGTKAGVYMAVLCSKGIDLQGEMAPLAATQVICFNIPAKQKAEDKRADISFDVRGFVEKSKGARACIVISVAGKTRVLEFPYGPTATEQQDFTRTFTQAAPQHPIENCPVTVVLVAERLSKADAVLVQLDSVDHSLKFEPQSQARKRKKDEVE